MAAHVDHAWACLHPDDAFDPADVVGAPTKQLAASTPKEVNFRNFPKIIMSACIAIPFAVLLPAEQRADTVIESYYSA